MIKYISPIFKVMVWSKIPKSYYCRIATSSIF